MISWHCFAVDEGPHHTVCSMFINNVKLKKIMQCSYLYDHAFILCQCWCCMHNAGHNAGDPVMCSHNSAAGAEQMA